MKYIFTCYTYLPKNLLVQLLTEQIVSKISNFNKIALKSTYLKLYMFNICQEMNQVILSYKLCGSQVFRVPEIDF